MNEILLQEIEKFGGKPENQKLTDKGFDKTGYEIAIIRATRDVTLRTLTRRSGKEGSLTSAILNEFLDEIDAFFSRDPYEKAEDFDDWHNKMCVAVLKTIREFYTQKNGDDVQYGKAQKIVNMTLKGCYCLILSLIHISEPTRH